MVASLVVGGVLLLAMIVASARGAVTLAADARIPVHCGSAEHCLLVSKRTGLIIWPAMGAVLFAVLGGIAESSLAAGWVPGVRDVLVPAALCVVLGFQAGALVLAGRKRETAGRLGNPPAGYWCDPVPRWPLPCAWAAYGRSGTDTAGTGRRYEDRQQSGQGNAGSAAR